MRLVRLVAVVVVPLLRRRPLRLWLWLRRRRPMARGERSSSRSDTRRSLVPYHPWQLPALAEPVATIGGWVTMAIKHNHSNNHNSSNNGARRQEHQAKPFHALRQPVHFLPPPLPAAQQQQRRRRRQQRQCHHNNTGNRNSNSSNNAIDVVWMRWHVPPVLLRAVRVVARVVVVRVVVVHVAVVHVVVVHVCHEQGLRVAWHALAVRVGVHSRHRHSATA